MVAVKRREFHMPKAEGTLRRPAGPYKRSARSTRFKTNAMVASPTPLHHDVNPTTTPAPSSSGRDPNEQLEFAGLCSDSLSRQVLHARVNAAAGTISVTAAELEERIRLAKRFCEVARTLNETALGAEYYQDPETRRYLIGIAYQIIFARDEAIREEFRTKLAKTAGVVPHPFVPYRMS
jgi:hypothetical protein